MFEEPEGGLYWQWTTKIANKTVTRRLTDREAALCNEWTANNRQVRQLITQMRQISDRAAELIITSDTDTGQVHISVMRPEHPSRG